MGYTGFGFGGMFGMMPALVTVLFVVVIGIIVVQAVRGVSQWHANNQSPVLTVEAEMVAKRAHVTRHRHTSGEHNEFHHTTTSTTYYATFQVDSGDRLEFRVPDMEYGMLVEGDRGSLTFQGTRYHGFSRQ